MIALYCTPKDGDLHFSFLPTAAGLLFDDKDSTFEVAIRTLTELYIDVRNIRVVKEPITIQEELKYKWPQTAYSFKEYQQSKFVKLSR